MPRPLTLSREVDATCLCPEDHAALIALAKDRGVTKAEAMRDRVECINRGLTPLIATRKVFIPLGSIVAHRFFFQRGNSDL